MRSKRWAKATFWPLIAASVMFIVVYSWQVIANFQGAALVLSNTLIHVTWVIFAADYVVQLLLAKRRGRWFFRHLFDLAVVLLPALRPLQLLKALTVVHTLNRTVGSALRNSIAVYGVGAAILLVWVSAVAVLEAERPAPGATIVNFGDAIWWAFVTLATVGYGDYYPVTPQGRVVAVFLMCGGLVVVAVITATFASWVIEKVTAAEKSTSAQDVSAPAVQDED